MIINETNYNKYGLVPSPIDERDYQYKNIKTINANRLPSSFRLDVNGVKDQDVAGACVGFAASVIQEMDAKTNGEFDLLSPLFIYQMCKSTDGLPKVEGTNIRALMKVLKNNGVCKESLHPYKNPSEYKLLKFPIIEPDTFLDATSRKITGYARLSKVAEVKQAIYDENGVILSIIVSETVKKPINGVIGDIMGFVEGYHAIPLIGWDDNKEVRYQSDDGVKTSKGCFIFINSWGTQWGDNGFGYIPYAIFDIESKKQPPFEFKLIDEAWTTIHDRSNSKGDKDYHKKKYNSVEPKPQPPKPEPTPDVEPEDDVKKVSIAMQIGNKNARINNLYFRQLNKEPVNLNGSTMLPLRAFEIIGGQVKWDNYTKTATIKFTEESVRKAFDEYNKLK